MICGPALLASCAYGRTCNGPLGIIYRSTQICLSQIVPAIALTTNPGSHLFIPLGGFIAGIARPRCVCSSVFCKYISTARRLKYWNGLRHRWPDRAAPIRPGLNTRVLVLTFRYTSLPFIFHFVHLFLLFLLSKLYRQFQLL